MYSVLAYFVTIFVIVISVFTTLFIKNELERLIREKDVLPFHICNVIIVLMVSMLAHAVMTIYIIGNEFNWIPQLIILMCIIVPIYLLGHFAFEKYKLIYRKYIPTENRKVVILNEKYLKKKKLPSKFKDYNSLFKE
jgi:amino acid transporter